MARAEVDGARARIPTVVKMVQLLRAFTPATPTWKLLELSRNLGWDGATTHRFLKALVEARMLDVDSDLRYRIGPLPLQLAAVAASVEPGWKELLSRLPEVADRTQLTTQIGVLDAGAVSIIASHESGGALKAAASLGERLPLHATAGGKAILAQLSDAEIVETLPAKLERFTEHTIVSRTALIDQLNTVRESGLAFVDSELSLGLSAAAVAIPSSWFGTAPAALVCAGLSRDLVADQWEEADRTLLELKAHFASPGSMATRAAMAPASEALA